VCDDVIEIWFLHQHIISLNPNCARHSTLISSRRVSSCNNTGRVN
jgi:hypothetical protein